jgi:hypothetical protein
MRQNLISSFLVAILIAASGGRLLAQDQQQNRSANQLSPLVWKVEPILERYVSHMARHYNLNEHQTEYTRQLLTQRVKRFLKDYEKDVRSLMAEYYSYQMGRQLPSVEVAKDLAQRGTPLFAAIRKEIIEGNMLWRKVLNEDQKRKHDKDLELMKDQFDKFENKLQRWSEGKLDEDDMGRAAKIDRHQPRRYEDFWDFRVRSFILDYGLRPGQQETAYSILRELKKEAARYREKHATRFASLEARYNEIYNSAKKTTPEELKKAQETLKSLREEQLELERPIREELYNQLLRRLNRIPTQDQRRSYREHMGKLDKLGQNGQTTQPSTQPEDAETQPADSSETRPSEATAEG